MSLKIFEKCLCDLDIKFEMEATSLFIDSSVVHFHTIHFQGTDTEICFRQLLHS